MKTTKLFQFLIIASLLLSIAVPPSQSVSEAKAQPVLVELAAQDPHRWCA